MPPLTITNFTGNNWNPGLLLINTTYYWKIVAYDIYGDSTQGAVWNFTTKIPFDCGDILVDVRDGQSYNTVLIGEQCWMAENLNIGVMSLMNQSNNGIIEKFCYDDDTTNCQIYGGLFRWQEAMQYSTQSGIQGICPDGWKIPTDEEWCILTQFIDTNVNCNNFGYSGIDAGLKIKSSLGWYSGGNGTDTYGFNGLPSGISDDHTFVGIGKITWFLSSTVSGPYDDFVLTRNLKYDNDKIGRGEIAYFNGGSVRCIKRINHSPLIPTNPLPPDGATAQTTNMSLSWLCSDPDDDDLTYNIYFGTETNPPLIEVNLTTNTWSPGLLNLNTTYYWKIVAYDIYGDSTQGPVWNFTTKIPFDCGDILVDDRDGQSYNTVLIGEQCWMAENLNIGTMISGQIYMTNNDVIEKYCYENDTANCDTYGGLYEWGEIMEYTTTPGMQGICPADWHLPTDLEWTLIANYLGGDSIAGGKMKEAGFTHWSPPNTDATNESAFTGLPGGAKYSWNEFSSIDSIGRWWSSTKYYWDKKMNLYNFYKGFLSYSFGLSYNNANMFRNSSPHDAGFSVRCMRDNPGSGFPNVTTSYIFNINEFSATGGGIVIAQGNAAISERGICWSTSQYPTINDPHTNDGEGIGPFISEIIGLNNNTIYYVRAYAINNSGFTAYGNMVSFYTQIDGGGGVPCANIPTVTYEGQVYNTVQIGNQCWFRENINIGVKINGPYLQTDNGQIEKHCYYDEPGFCDIYGGLYQWNEMMNYVSTEGSQGICPNGWHIPTIPEWNTLFEFLSGVNFAGGKMKEAGLAHWIPPNTAATNESGFTGLPGGYFESYFYFGIGNYGRWWTSNSINNAAGHGIKMTYNNPGINSFSSFAIRESNSVRCIKNEYVNQPPLMPYYPQPIDSAANQLVNLTLSWTCNDPENDTLTFDVYFGTTETPLLVSEGQSDAIYNPGLLEYSTTFYWKIAAHDDHGNTTEGPVWSFSTIDEPTWSCGDLLNDTRDGQTYNTVQIGEQCWMAENLNIGTIIPGANSMTNNAIIEKYCYDNNTANCDTYGGLYQWNEMMQYTSLPGVQGICPEGWHLPTDEEWTALTTFLGGQNIAGGKMKATGTIETSTGLWYNPNSGATNECGFTAIPGGTRNYFYGYFSNLGNLAYFWSSTECDFNIPWNRELGYDGASVSLDCYSENGGFSVRCVQGENVNAPPSLPSTPQPSDGSTNQLINIFLSWSCTDPDNDPLTYDIYFSPSNPPALISTGQSATTFNPGGLSYNTTYYWKIVAHDDQSNTTEGVIWSFITQDEPIWYCGDLLNDTRDDQTYNTVQIGDQCWMAENLNIGAMVQSTTELTNNSIIEKYCYDNNTANCDTYGSLYQWNEMMEYTTTEGTKGICPIEWHIPTDTEWCTLTLFVDPTVNCNAIEFSGTNAGTKMKSTSGWNYGGNGTNTSGFTALPGASLNNTGYFYDLGSRADFWSSTEINTSYAWGRSLISSYANVDRGSAEKNYGFSVRCVKSENINHPPSLPSAPQPSDGETNHLINTTLSWSCTDPENDPLTYDVYFGMSNPPSLVSAGQSATTFNPGTLSYSTTYYWKIAAHDDHSNSAEGPVWTFTTLSVPTWQCGDPMTDARDNQIYNTVQIGSQCWMAQNLNIGNMVNGSSNQTNNSIIEKYCYTNNAANCATYGGLYLWNEMMQYSTTPGVKGICPAGWHLPTDAEWTILTTFLGGESVSGGKMKSTGTIEAGTGLWYDPNAGATNESGFSALPGGCSLSYGHFSDLGYIAFFWSSTEYSTDFAWLRALSCSGADGYDLNGPKYYGFSSRCLKD